MLLAGVEQLHELPCECCRFGYRPGENSRRGKVIPLQRIACVTCQLLGPPDQGFPSAKELEGSLRPDAQRCHINRGRQTIPEPVRELPRLVHFSVCEKRAVDHRTSVASRAAKKSDRFMAICD